VRSIIVALLAAALGLAVVPASSQPGGVVVSPNSATYYPGGQGRSDPLIIQEGDELRYVQADVTITHSITSYRDEPYDIGPGDPGFFDSGQVRWGAYVVDTTELAVGSYPFFCTIHPGMRGLLQVIERFA